MVGGVVGGDIFVIFCGEVMEAGLGWVWCRVGVSRTSVVRVLVYLLCHT